MGIDFVNFAEFWDEPKIYKPWCVISPTAQITLFCLCNLNNVVRSIPGRKFNWDLKHNTSLDNIRMRVGESYELQQRECIN